MPELNLNNNNLEDSNKKNKMSNIFDDIEIIVDPDLEDESTVDINDYLNKYILQCRICGNLFPSDTMLDSNNECPICDTKTSNGYIYKGKLINKNKNEDVTDEEIEAIDDINDEEEAKSYENDLKSDNDEDNDIMTWDKDEDDNMELNIES